MTPLPSNPNILRTCQVADEVLHKGEWLSDEDLLNGLLHAINDADPEASFEVAFELFASVMIGVAAQLLARKTAVDCAMSGQKTGGVQ